MRTWGPQTWFRWVVVGALGSLVGCGGGTAHDGGTDAVVPGDTGVADVPVGVPPDAGIDLMPDAMPDLMPDLGIPCGDAGDSDGGDGGGGGVCPMALSCCSSYCIDIGRDPRNCGACGTACAATQFCTGTACSETSFAKVCDNPHVTVIQDLYDTDNNAAAAIGSALVANCMPAPTLVTKSQVAQDVLDFAGRPLAGGSTSYITGGGSFGQDLIKYLDKASLTAVYLTGDVERAVFRKRDGQDVVSAIKTTLTDGHDFFLVELTVEPVSGTLSVAAMGMFAPGTTAAAHWVSTEMIPKRATYPDTWYVFEWTDSGDKVPNAADTFTMVAHGR